MSNNDNSHSLVHPITTDIPYNNEIPQPTPQNEDTHSFTLPNPGLAPPVYELPVPCTTNPAYTAPNASASSASAPPPSGVTDDESVLAQAVDNDISNPDHSPNSDSSNGSNSMSEVALATAAALQELAPLDLIPVADLTYVYPGVMENVSLGHFAATDLASMTKGEFAVRKRLGQMDLYETLEELYVPGSAFTQDLAKALLAHGLHLDCYCTDQDMQGIFQEYSDFAESTDIYVRYIVKLTDVHPEPLGRPTVLITKLPAKKSKKPNHNYPDGKSGKATFTMEEAAAHKMSIKTAPYVPVAYGNYTPADMLQAADCAYKHSPPLNVIAMSAMHPEIRPNYRPIMLQKPIGPRTCEGDFEDAILISPQTRALAEEYFAANFPLDSFCAKHKIALVSAGWCFRHQVQVSAMDDPADVPNWMGNIADLSMPRGCSSARRAEIGRLRIVAVMKHYGCYNPAIAAYCERTYAIYNWIVAAGITFSQLHDSDARVRALFNYIGSMLQDWRTVSAQASVYVPQEIFDRIRKAEFGRRANSREFKDALQSVPENSRKAYTYATVGASAVARARKKGVNIVYAGRKTSRQRQIKSSRQERVEERLAHEFDEQTYHLKGGLADTAVATGSGPTEELAASAAVSHLRSESEDPDVEVAIATAAEATAVTFHVTDPDDPPVAQGDIEDLSVPLPPVELVPYSEMSFTQRLTAQARVLRHAVSVLPHMVRACHDQTPFNCRTLNESAVLEAQKGPLPWGKVGFLDEANQMWHAYDFKRMTVTELLIKAGLPIITLPAIVQFASACTNCPAGVLWNAALEEVWRTIVEVNNGDSALLGASETVLWSIIDPMSLLARTPTVHLHLGATNRLRRSIELNRECHWTLRITSLGYNTLYNIAVHASWNLMAAFTHPIVPCLSYMAVIAKSQMERASHVPGITLGQPPSMRLVDRALKKKEQRIIGRPMTLKEYVFSWFSTGKPKAQGFGDSWGAIRDWITNSFLGKMTGLIAKHYKLLLKCAAVLYGMITQNAELAAFAVYTLLEEAEWTIERLRDEMSRSWVVKLGEAELEVYPSVIERYHAMWEERNKPVCQCPAEMARYLDTFTSMYPEQKHSMSFILTKIYAQLQDSQPMAQGWQEYMPTSLIGAVFGMTSKQVTDNLREFSLCKSLGVPDMARRILSRTCVTLFGFDPIDPEGYRARCLAAELTSMANKIINVPLTIENCELIKEWRELYLKQKPFLTRALGVTEGRRHADLDAIDRQLSSLMGNVESVLTAHDVWPQAFWVHLAGPPGAGKSALSNYMSKRIAAQIVERYKRKPRPRAQQPIDQAWVRNMAEQYDSNYKDGSRVLVIAEAGTMLDREENLKTMRTLMLHCDPNPTPLDMADLERKGKNCNTQSIITNSNNGFDGIAKTTLADDEALARRLSIILQVDYKLNESKGLANEDQYVWIIGGDSVPAFVEWAGDRAAARPHTARSRRYATRWWTTQRTNSILKMQAHYYQTRLSTFMEFVEHRMDYLWDNAPAELITEQSTKYNQPMQFVDPFGNSGDDDDDDDDEEQDDQATPAMAAAAHDDGAAKAQGWWDSLGLPSQALELISRGRELVAHAEASREGIDARATQLLETHQDIADKVKKWVDYLDETRATVKGWFERIPVRKILGVSLTLGVSLATIYSVMRVFGSVAGSIPIPAQNFKHERTRNVRFDVRKAYKVRALQKRNPQAASLKGALPEAAEAAALPTFVPHTTEPGASAGWHVHVAAATVHFAIEYGSTKQHICGLAVTGDSVIMPKHAWSWEPTKVELWQGGVKKYEGLAFDEDDTLTAIEGMDLCIWRMPRSQGMKLKAVHLNSFVVANRLPSSGSVTRVSVGKMAIAGLLSSGNLIVAPAHATGLTYNQGTTAIRCENTFSYQLSVPTAAGDCGTVLTVGQNIVGMHVAGSSHAGYAMVLTQELVTQLISESGITAEGFVTTDFLDVPGMEVLRYAPELRTFAPEGVEIDASPGLHKRPHYVRDTTKFMKTEFHDAIYGADSLAGLEACKRFLPPMRTHIAADGTRTDSLEHTLAAKRPHRLSDHAGFPDLDTIMPLLARELAHGPYEGDGSWRVAVLGDNSNIEPLCLNTSPGLPWTQYPEFGNDKRELVKFDVKTGEYWIHPLLLESIEYVERRMLDEGTIPAQLFSVNKKDELRPAHKRIRLIYGSSLGFTMLVRKWFEALISAAKVKYEGALTIGINVYQEWTAMVGRLYGFIPDSSTIGDLQALCLDFGGYDRSFLAKDWEAIEAFVEHWYGPSDPQANKVRRLLLLSMRDRLDDVQGYLCDEGPNHPSGDPLCAILNGFLNFIMANQAHLIAGRKAISLGEQMPAHVRLAFEHSELYWLRMAMYGDDNIMAVNPEFLQFIVDSPSYMKNFVAAYATWHKEVTDERKNHDIGFKKLVESTFLKRGFVVHNELGISLVACPLDIQSVASIAAYAKSNDPVQREAAFINFQWELSLHGKEAYDSLMQRILPYNVHHFQVHSWSEMYARVMRLGELHAQGLIEVQNPALRNLSISSADISNIQTAKATSGDMVAPIDETSSVVNATSGHGTSQEVLATSDPVTSTATGYNPNIMSGVQGEFGSHVEQLIELPNTAVAMTATHGTVTWVGNPITDVITHCAKDIRGMRYISWDKIEYTLTPTVASLITGRLLLVVIPACAAGHGPTTDSEILSYPHQWIDPHERITTTVEVPFTTPRRGMPINSPSVPFIDRYSTQTIQLFVWDQLQDTLLSGVSDITFSVTMRLYGLRGAVTVGVLEDAQGLATTAEAATAANASDMAAPEQYGAVQPQHHHHHSSGLGDLFGWIPLIGKTMKHATNKVLNAVPGLKQVNGAVGKAIHPIAGAVESAVTQVASPIVDVVKGAAGDIIGAVATALPAAVAAASKPENRERLPYYLQRTTDPAFGAADGSLFCIVPGPYTTTEVPKEVAGLGASGEMFTMASMCNQPCYVARQELNNTATNFTVPVHPLYCDENSHVPLTSSVVQVPYGRMPFIFNRHYNGTMTYYLMVTMSSMTSAQLEIYVGPPDMPSVLTGRPNTRQLISLAGSGVYRFTVPDLTAEWRHRAHPRSVETLDDFYKWEGLAQLHFNLRTPVAGPASAVNPNIRLTLLATLEEGAIVSSLVNPQAQAELTDLGVLGGARAAPLHVGLLNSKHAAIMGMVHTDNPIGEVDFGTVAHGDRFHVRFVPSLPWAQRNAVNGRVVMGFAGGANILTGLGGGTRQSALDKIMRFAGEARGGWRITIVPRVTAAAPTTLRIIDGDRQNLISGKPLDQPGKLVTWEPGVPITISVGHDSAYSGYKLWSEDTLTNATNMCADIEFLGPVSAALGVADIYMSGADDVTFSTPLHGGAFDYGVLYPFS